MARKGRNLASFDELASRNIAKQIENGESNNINTNNDISLDNNINNNVDVNQKGTTNINNNINDNVNDDEIINDNGNINVDDNINVNVNKNEDYLDQIINSTKKKKGFEQKPTGIYLEEDLSKILNELAKKGGRGAKSKIVNEALRAIFIEKGLIK